jgi:polysaccharide biosynthesis protein PslH
MRILYLCQRIPYPPDRGDRIPVFHHIKRLNRNHEVVVGSLTHSGSGANADKLKKELDIGVIAPNQTSFRRLQGMILALLQGKPLSLGYFRNPKLRTLIQAEMAQRPFDIIIVFSSSMAQYAEQSGSVRRIMNFCDVDSQKWSSMAQKSYGLKKWIYKRESRILLKYERMIASQFNISCVVAENEAELFRKYIPGIPVRVVENGVDVDYFNAVSRNPDGLRIVFVGVMDYPPNIEAASFFAKEIMTRIRAIYPEACFIIVGAQPTTAVENLAAIPGVEVTGYVPDTRPYLAAASLAVVPLAIARGVQNKILEAMAAGVPVLTTPSVAEALPAGAAQHVFTAERETEAFVSAISELLKDRSRLERQGAAAKDFVGRQCTWDAKLKALDEIIADSFAERKQ